MRNAWLAGLFGISLFVASATVRAECIENTRAIVLAKDDIVRLKSYRCRSDEVEVRIEFHRFSDLPASLIVGKATSSLLTKTIGTPKVIENEVYNNYADLLNRFGTTGQKPRQQDIPTETSFHLGAAGKTATHSVTDSISANRVRTISGLFGQNSIAYPAANEIVSLRAKTIPDDMHYYYYIGCGDLTEKSSRSTCSKINSTDKIFWRGMRSEDLANYTRNVGAYNRLLKPAKDEQISSVVPKELKLTQYLAGGDWPDDFMILVGNNSIEGCGEEAGHGRWDFQAWPRAISMDGVLIENMSKSPLRISGLLGGRLTQPRLRVAAVSATGTSTDSVETLSEIVAPGHRLLIPTRIGFSPSDGLKDSFGYPRIAADIHKRLGSDGFKGNTAAFGAPATKNYTYGTELVISGLVANGKPMLLNERPLNFIDITLASLIGSCPYLLSRDDSNGDWIEHGKVLHKANGRRSEYTETVTLPGYRHRFRIEEREPEIAFMDQAELNVVMKNGEMISIKPNHPRLTERDGDYLRLFWGDAVDLEFTLPDRVSAKDVTESRLTVAGYYVRYSDLPIMSERASAWRAKLANYTPVPAASVTGGALICPAP